MSNDRHILTPAESGRLGVQVIERLRDNADRMMPIGLGGMDDYFVPLEPGSMTVVNAQTHNGKSWFLNRWKRRMLAHLKANNRDEVIVWVDTETPADYLAMNQISSLSGISYREIISSRGPGLDMGALIRAAGQVAQEPVYTIATRLGRDWGEVHLTNIRKGLNMLVEGQVDGKKRKIAAVFIDYLQSLPYDPVVRKQRELSDQRRLQVSRDVDTCRFIASEMDCPVIIGVQSKQTPEPSAMWKALHLPGMYDGQETANIAQKPDRILTLSVAARNFTKGTVLEYGGGTFTVRDNLMFVGVLKQRGEGFPAGNVFLYEMDGKTNDPYGSMIHLWSDV